MSRRRSRVQRSASAVKQLPWGSFANAFSPIEVLDDDQLDTIIDSALKLLADYQQPALDPAVDEPLVAYTLRRKQSLADSGA